MACRIDRRTSTIPCLLESPRLSLVRLQQLLIPVFARALLLRVVQAGHVMTRPAYGTLDDRKNAHDIALAVVRNGKYGDTLIEQPEFETVDYILNRNCVPVAGLECKRRFVPHNRYPTYDVSMDKITNGMRWCGDRDIPDFIIAVGYDDAVVTFDVLTIALAGGIESGLGGRKDRSDAADIELMAKIPMRLGVVIAWWRGDCERD